MPQPLVEMTSHQRHLHPDTWTICILAGGRSRRMGREKSRIRVNGTTLLDRTKTAAKSIDCNTITLRTDAIPNCGPLSGIYTGLIRSRTDWCLFVACDMPLISTTTIERLMSATNQRMRPVFTESKLGYGFPLSLSSEHLTIVREMVNDGKRSLVQLANEVHPHRFSFPRNRQHELFNANTPEDLRKLRQIIHAREA